MDPVDSVDRPEQTDRRTLLKRVGVVGVGIWAAPVVTSISSPAFAGGSPSPTLCITLESQASVSVEVTFYGACNTLEFGLQSPSQQLICRPCSVGSGAQLGTFSAGTELVFYLADPADCCGCPQRYTCNDTKNAQVIRVNATTYRLRFRDNGCGCGSSDISEGANLEATVTLS